MVKAQVVSVDGIHTAGSFASTLYYIEVCDRVEDIEGVACAIFIASYLAR